jgi:hypothetical protein
VTFTPQLDALAEQGAVFPRFRNNGQTCKPARAALMLGRFLRHHRNAANPLGGEVRQCGHAPLPSSVLIDEPFGCSSGAQCGPTTNGMCEPIHTVAWWLNNWDRIFVGKYEFGSSPTNLSFDPPHVQDGPGPAMGKFCDQQSVSCDGAFAAGQIPQEAVANGNNRSLDELVDRIRQNVVNDTQTDPFLVWYAVNVPHEPGVYPYFQTLYEPFAGGTFEDEQHQARTSLFDAGLGVLTDELKRMCVCDENGQPESVYDNTTIVVVPDHGFLLQRAKNDDGFAAENAHRAMLIVNAPDHRSATPPAGSAAALGHPAIVDPSSQFPTAPDLLPTVLDYAGLVGGDTQDNYPLNRSLAPFALQGNGTTAAPGPFLRRAAYGHSGENGSIGGVAAGDNRYVVPRPGVLGLCTHNQAGTVPIFTASKPPHVKPCLVNNDCGAGKYCIKKARRCINDPGRLCQTDFDCVSCVNGACESGYDGLSCNNDAACPVNVPCVSGVCASSGFADVDGRPCQTAEACHPFVPRGACQPAMIKFVVKNSSPVVARVDDLHFDPDEGEPNAEGSTNLLAEDSDYLGPPGTNCVPQAGTTELPVAASLYNKLFCCVREFFTLDTENTTPPNSPYQQLGASGDLWRPRAQCGCPAALREWPVVNTNASCGAS